MCAADGDGQAEALLPTLDRISYNRTFFHGLFGGSFQLRAALQERKKVDLDNPRGEEFPRLRRLITDIIRGRLKEQEDTFQGN